MTATAATLTAEIKKAIRTIVGDFFAMMNSCYDCVEVSDVILHAGAHLVWNDQQHASEHASGESLDQGQELEEVFYISPRDFEALGISAIFDILPPNRAISPDEIRSLDGAEAYLWAFVTSDMHSHGTTVWITEEAEQGDLFFTANRKASRLIQLAGVGE